MESSCGFCDSGLFDDPIIASIGIAWKVHETIFGPLEGEDEDATIFRNCGHCCPNKKEPHPYRILSFRKYFFIS